jgi:hypothetical protein
MASAFLQDWNWSRVLISGWCNPFSLPAIPMDIVEKEGMKLGSGD